MLQIRIKPNTSICSTLHKACITRLPITDNNEHVYHLEVYEAKEVRLARHLHTNCEVFQDKDTERSEEARFIIPYLAT